MPRRIPTVTNQLKVSDPLNELQISPRIRSLEAQYMQLESLLYKKATRQQAIAEKTMKQIGTNPLNKPICIELYSLAEEALFDVDAVRERAQQRLLKRNEMDSKPASVTPQPFQQPSKGRQVPWKLQEKLFEYDAIDNKRRLQKAAEFNRRNVGAVGSRKV